jgi:hypothetical protein
MGEPTPPTIPNPGDERRIVQPEFKRGRRYELTDEYFSRILAGVAELPNFEPIEHWQALAASMGYGRTVETYRPEGKTYDVRTEARIPTRFLDPAVYYLSGRGAVGKAIYHLSVSQGGGLTGEGVAVIDVSGLVKYRSIPESIVAGHFAICQHEKIEGDGANHDHGWHPGYCGKCGLDMSVDSGD